MAISFKIEDFVRDIHKLMFITNHLAIDPGVNHVSGGPSWGDCVNLARTSMVFYNLIPWRTVCDWDGYSQMVFCVDGRE